MALPYPGRIPSNVSRDAKYSVVHGQAGMEVRLVYTVSAGERELLTTDRHDRLVDLVNEVKVEHAGAPGGVFYINEFSDVLVPTADGCFYAGNYRPLLEFDFEGTVLGPHAPTGLRPGDTWPGPHVGVRYTLAAAGWDVKYERHVTRTRTKTELLSDHVGSAAAGQLARRIGEHKGQGGGRIYINEACEFFSPVPRGRKYEHVYLGPLHDDAWFEAPDVPRGDD